ncbi:MAG: flotillin-like protein FloA [Clostridiales bacterium]|nr:flotillin-like protein FloA [Clostridiales bacterium]MDY4655641.1 flotillin-like protein FloA [Eubacteriales bacterium]
MASLLALNIPLLVFGIVFAVVVVVAFFIIVPISTWFRALVSGAYISMGKLIGMRLRKIKIGMIVEAYITGKKAGLNINIGELETHYMAKGDVVKVVNALISAHSANIELSTRTAMAIDLAGRDVLNAVKVSVNPKVIETPVIAAIAKDGIELRCKARVTVRANISRLIGGAGEETIIARVGEGIVTTVGSALTHKDVLENPDRISKTVLQKGLDSGTAFEILSIDIADVDVGRNIGAQLQMDQAEADKRIAQAKAEERRAMAVATEQEMKAKTQEMRAVVIEAEAEVPKAMADALRNGKLGVMDYYNMQNLQADTNMRNAISGTDKASSDKK